MPTIRGSNCLGSDGIIDMLTPSGIVQANIVVSTSPLFGPDGVSNHSGLRTGGISMPIDARFWSKVDKTGDCWVWTAGTRGRGSHRYGAIRINGKNRSAHRVSWELTNGPIPGGLVVCHHCDNPPCVRPDHLFLGTVQDNALDRDRKGRSGLPASNQNPDHIRHRAAGIRAYWEQHPGARAGSKAGFSKLTEQQALEIIATYKAGGITQEQLGRRYGVNQRTVSTIITGTHWRHLATTRWPGW